MRNKQVVWPLILLAVAACAGSGTRPAATSAPHLIRFSISHISVEPSGKTFMELGVSNTGAQELPAGKYVAHFALTHADGTLRATSDTMLPRIPPSSGDLTTVVSINTPLEAGEYRATWGVSGLGSTQVTFELVAENGGLQSRLQSVVDYGPGYPYATSAWGQ